MTDEQRERLKTLLLSGGVSGALLGGGGSLLTGAKSLGKVGKAAALGAAISGGLSAGSGLLGDKLITPDPNDPQGNTKRGALGGLVAGGLGGAALGGLIGGKSGISRTVKAALMNKLGRGFMAKEVGKLASPLAGAATIGGLGALVGGYQASDEGMQADMLENIKRQKMRERMREQYLA